MKIEEMKEIKRNRGLTYDMIARGSGISIGTVKKLFGGYVMSPRFDTLAALERYFITEQGKAGNYGAFATGALKVNDVAVDWDASLAINREQGEYTLKDLELFPEEIRAELIDGKLYCQAAPTPVHQKIQMLIGMKLDSYINERSGRCEVGIAATDFKMDVEDDRTILQPDVFVVCDESKLGLKRITGAPDLAIEIRSPSNTPVYMMAKLCKYQECGVRECWVVDYELKKIIVYNFETKLTSFYGFRDRVPVGIFEDFVIDFSSIDDRVEAYVAKCKGRE